jgi:hypothetical protein
VSLQIRPDRVASAWLVPRAALRGHGHALEFFDDGGGPRAAAHERARGNEPDPERWLALVGGMVDLAPR